MRQYEAVYIIDPTLEEEQQNALVERFTTLVSTNGGEIQHLDRWERRRLAYEIKGRREGYYVVMNFNGTPATEAELGRVFGITDGVIRHLIVRMDERTAQKAIAEARAASEAKARAQAEAEARAAEEARTAEAAAAAAAAAAPAAAPAAAAPVEAAAPAPAEAAAAPAEEAPAPQGDGAETTQETGVEETGTA